jgi:hypothetical protein
MVDRRTVLHALTALAAAPAFAQGTAAPNAAQFAALSAALTGYAAPDAQTAAAMQKAFATPARRTQLAALAKLVAATKPADLDAALRGAKLETLANDLVAAWYSGIVTNGSAQQLVLYTNAYVWTAMTYSKPMGVCGGVTGYWAKPPA